MWIFEWVFGWFGPTSDAPRVGIHFMVEPNNLDFIEQTEDIDTMVH